MPARLTLFSNFYKALILSCLAFAWSAKAGLLVAMPEGDYSPQYRVQDGHASGFLPSVIKAFAVDAGLEFEFQALPIKRYQLLLENGQVDFILPSNPSWGDNASGNLLFSNAIVLSRSGFVRRRQDAGEPVEAVATVSGYTLPAATYLTTSVQTFETINTYASLEMLRAKRVDAVYAHLDFVRQWMVENDLKGELYFEKDAGHDSYAYHLATLNHSAVIAEFDTWLQHNADKVDRLRQQYGVGLESIMNF